jgi:LPXTG-motif cell wall-anchored protein
MFGFGGITTRFDAYVIGHDLQITGNAVGASVQGGELALVRSTISGSVALPADNPFSVLSGFGIVSASAGSEWTSQLHLASTTVSGNASAGIAAAPESSGLILHSTIAENGGVGIVHGFGVTDPELETGPFLVASSTIADNTEGALQVDGGALETVGSIVQAPEGVPACSGDPDGMTDSGLNVFSDDSCVSAGTSLVADAQLGPLADNGGPTLTMLPGAASPALDLIAPGGTHPGNGYSVRMCGDEFDQRGSGFPRLYGPACDAGSVELSSGVITVTASDATTYVGAVEPEITAGYSGFLPGDTVADLDTLPTCGYDIDAAATTCSGGADDVYTFEYVNGTLTVLDPLVFVTDSLPDATVGQEYSVTLEASGGDGGPYTWGIAEGSALPAGLELDTETGVISGIPEVAGAATFTLFVGDPIYQDLTITIAPAPTEPTDPPTSVDPTDPPTSSTGPTEQPTDAVPAPTGGSDDPGQGLPDTGADGLTALALSAAILLLGCAVVLVTRRHRHVGPDA